MQGDGSSSLSLKTMVERHDEDLYRGDPPGTGLTTRMALVENDIAKLSRNANKLVFAAVTTLLAVVADVISRHFFH